MIDTTNISENYSKAKDTIIRLIADRYRPEYYDLIVDRINRAYIDFSSTPDEEYQYMLEHDKYFSTEDMKPEKIPLIYYLNMFQIN